MIDIEIELKTGILRKCHSETKRKANALSNKKKASNELSGDIMKKFLSE